MTLRLFDTYTRSLRDFEPLDPASIRMYACGPTVYDYAHIGNLRTYIFEDILRRVLEFNGYKVKQVMNITDVGHLVSDADTGEDKMELGARRAGRSAWEIADYYTQEFKQDLTRLNILEPTIWCKATDNIPEQIEMIRCIEAKGFTYRTSDGIYFDTSHLADYGHLARLDTRGLQAGARVDKGEKRNPTDFALWKFSPADQNGRWNGTARGVSVFPDGTSNVPLCPPNTWVLSLTFIAAAKITFRFITRMKSPRLKRATERVSPTFGCMVIFYFSSRRRWRNRQAIFCARRP